MLDRAIDLGHHALSSCDPDRPETDERWGASCFDSSRELRDGLLVTEYPNLAALMQALVCAPVLQ